MNTITGAIRVAEADWSSPTLDSAGPDAISSNRLAEWLRTAADIMVQYDRKNAVEAHTIYRRHGTLAGVVERSGRIVFADARDFRAGGGLRPYDEADERGLIGDPYTDFVAERIARHLRHCYGPALEVEPYRVGAAPSMGAVREEMFGLTRERLWILAAVSARNGRPSELLQGVVIFPRT